jgi:hypothetical protein
VVGVASELQSPLSSGLDKRMLSRISHVEIVQNPAFGAQLLWNFGRGYQTERIDHLPLMPSFFLVLPLILHAPTLSKIKSTLLSSGLAKLVGKIGEERERLYAIHERALSMRELTLQSVSVGTTAGLLHIDYATAAVRANELKMPPHPERLKHHIGGAEKLGRWFARLPQSQVFSLMMVEP